MFAKLHAHIYHIYHDNDIIFFFLLIKYSLLLLVGV